LAQEVDFNFTSSTPPTPPRLKGYGVEPAKDTHANLRKTQKDWAWRMYQIIAAGVEPRTLMPGLAESDILHMNGDVGAGFSTALHVYV
jgi:hypothetical protein